MLRVGEPMIINLFTKVPDVRGNHSDICHKEAKGY